jgi:hypothetical protein
MAHEITDVSFQGEGPFRLPLLVEHPGLLLDDRLQEYAVFRFLCEDGPEIQISVSAQLIPSLIEGLKLWQSKIAARESSGSQKH